MCVTVFMSLCVCVCVCVCVCDCVCVTVCVRVCVCGSQTMNNTLTSVSAVLGFHSMLTQTQFYASLRDEKIHEGGFTGELLVQARLCLFL